MEAKKLEGNRSKRTLNRNEPQPTLGLPECPAIVEGEARREWDRKTKELLALRLLTVVHGAALTVYCQAWADWIEAREHLKVEPRVYKTEKGYPVLNPWYYIANNALAQMRGLWNEFGLTPAARTRLHVEPPADQNPRDTTDIYFD
jgi:P27 family predicted phage terminase small subunit